MITGTILNYLELVSKIKYGQNAAQKVSISIIEIN